MIPVSYTHLLEVTPNFNTAQNLTYNGWMAVLFSVIAVLVYIAGLMCSHKGAFRVATNLRLQTMEHIIKLPLGFVESFGSGKLRKIVNESSAATETYLAHQLPDRANAIATPCGLLVLDVYKRQEQNFPIINRSPNSGQLNSTLFFSNPVGSTGSS